MKKFVVFLFPLLLSSFNALALTPEEEQYFEEHCQDIRSSEDAKRKLSEAKKNKDQQEIDRVYDCLGILSKQMIEMVENSVEKKQQIGTER